MSYQNSTPWLIHRAALAPVDRIAMHQTFTAILCLPTFQGAR